MNALQYYVYPNGAQIGGFSGPHEPPLGGLAVSPPPEHADQPWLFPGWGPSPGLAVERETQWRANQMPVARENVTAIEFGDASIPGTAGEWKAFWLALRAWVGGAPGYPASKYRPTAPQGDSDGSERIEDGGTPRVPG